LSEYKPFYNNWIDINSLFIKENANRFYDLLYVNLEKDFFLNLQFDAVSLKNYRIKAAIEASKIVGMNPALCFSGGIDSQCMLQAWSEADLKFDVYTLKFKNNLNIQDVQHAENFCKQYNVELKIIEIDIISFLNRENFDYALKYDSVSPHFNTHYKLFDILKSKGYSGVCCGGSVPIRNGLDNSWGSNFNRNPLNFIKYTEISQFPCVGNFLSFYPDLSWGLALLTPAINLQHGTYINYEQTVRDFKETERYSDKCLGYRRGGFKIKEQSQKYTGFELVKKHLENLTNNGWEFEVRYRHPLAKQLNHSAGLPQFIFKDGVKEIIESIHNNNLTAGHGSSSGI